MWPVIKKNTVHKNRSWITLVLQLAGRDFTGAIIGVFKELKDNISLMSEQMKNLRNKIRNENHRF